jgi:hypothetical protein
LLVKTLAKPLSKRIKHEFSRYAFTQSILIGIGQGSHQLSSRMTIWSAGYKVRSIKPLEAEAAMKQGAEFVGESFILVVSAGVVLYEFNQSAEKAAAKEAANKAKTKADRDELQAKLHSLDVRLHALEDVVKQNSNSLLNLVGKRYKEPDQKELVAMEFERKDDEEDTAPATSIAHPVSASPLNADSSTTGPSVKENWWQWRPWN